MEYWTDRLSTSRRKMSLNWISTPKQNTKQKIKCDGMYQWLPSLKFHTETETDCKALRNFMSFFFSVSIYLIHSGLGSVQIFSHAESMSSILQWPLHHRHCVNIFQLINCHKDKIPKRTFSTTNTPCLLNFHFIDEKPHSSLLVRFLLYNYDAAQKYFLIKIHLIRLMLTEFRIRNAQVRGSLCWIKYEWKTECIARLKIYYLPNKTDLNFIN